MRFQSVGTGIVLEYHSPSVDRDVDFDEDVELVTLAGFKACDRYIGSVHRIPPVEHGSWHLGEEPRWIGFIGFKGRLMRFQPGLRWKVKLKTVAFFSGGTSSWDALKLQEIAALWLTTSSM